ncbi:MAG: type II toxin-antitoxin system prevent-host-death family antitoxin [Betaproteobacteria bacterium]|nr:MAG: type II toxin-antitoxin system prevent-host-death family antitoxin [Betaproteobacteria bacterium]
MQFNVHQAKSQLSQLLFAVEKGEEVVIARNGVPIAQLVATNRRAPERVDNVDLSALQSLE